MKFKVGDRVKCVEGKGKGDGWSLGYEFIIKEITGIKEGIYWPAKDDNGVLEDSLELASKDEIIYE